MLLREAYRRGLDQDAVVQRHLVQKMRLILAEDVPEPSRGGAQGVPRGQPRPLRGPPTVTLDHVFYADPASVPDDLLEQLRNGLEPDGLGDSLYMLGNTLPRYPLGELIGLMGPEVARLVFELPAGEWRGPLESARGVHLVRVAEHHPPTPPSFEELESYLRQDWTLDQQRRATAAKLAQLRHITGSWSSGPPDQGAGVVRPGVPTQAASGGVRSSTSNAS